MSVAKKEEVFNHRLAPRLGEPTVGVPIKKRPLSLPDKSVASGIPLSMKPLSTAPLEMSVSPAGPGCGKESFFNMSKSDTNMINKGNGITNSQIQIQDRCNRSFTTLSMTNSNGVLLNGSNEFPSFAESARSVAPVDEPQRQKFMALDLQLASCRSGKNNNGPVVKEEKAEHVFFFGFSSAQHPKNAQIESEINASSNSSIGKLPNLDLNVPFDPADSLEVLPTMHGNDTGMYHGTNQHQRAQVPLAAPVSTISSGLSRNIDSTLNLSNSCGLSHKCGSGDVTLDLQLKPPTRPEIGVNWKGLAPAPELSLSLFGKPVTEPKDFSAPNALFNFVPAGSSKKISEEAATPGSDKSPVEKIMKLVLCNANPRNTTSSVVSGSDNVVSNRLVKKEPEEPSQQHILNEAPLLQQQSVGLVSNCPAIKTGFDFNSDIFPNNSIHNGLDVATDNIPISAESLPAIVGTETLPAVPEVQKSVKCEETRSDNPSPAEATAGGHSAPLMAAKSLPLETNVPSPAVGLCESVSRQSISTSEPSCSNADHTPPASHLHSHAVIREALGSSSIPIAEPLVLNTRDHAAIEGMSQGSAEMDCSEDDDITISRRPTTDKPHVDPLDNSPTTKEGMSANNLCTELQKEHDSNTTLDRSSLSNKVSMEGADDDKCVKMRVCIVTHAGEPGHRNEDFVNEELKDKQLLKSDKNSPVSSSDNITHDVMTATGSNTTDFRRPSALQISTSPKMESTGQSLKTSDRFEKTRSPKIKSERSPLGKQAASCSKDHAKKAVVKTERQTESEEISKQSDVRPRDSVLSEESEFDRASSSQTNSECGKVKSASEKSDYDKSKPDSCRTSSVQNERDGQLVGHAYVNRNERWERFMESEGEKNKGENHGGRYASDMINQRRTDHRYSGRGGGSQGHPRNFRGPRMSNESEIPFADEPINGRRHPFEDDLGHLHRMPHKRRRGCLMSDMDIDGFTGREIPGPRLIEDLPDDMIEDRFFMPHSHRHHAQGDHGFIYKERSHSPAQRRAAPVHFHRGRSPEAMHRSPPLPRTERPYLPHRRHTRRHGSPPDHDERGMQRNTRPRCGMIGSHQAPEGDAFEPPFHPAQLAEFHAEEELAERRRHGERRAYLRSLEAGAPVADEEDMLPYHAEDGDMEGGGPRDLDGRFRNRLGHGRARREQQEDGYRQHRGPQGWRDGDSNGSRPPKRWRY